MSRNDLNFNAIDLNFNALSSACFANAKSKGFYDTLGRIQDILEGSAAEGYISLEEAAKLNTELLTIWRLSRIALIMSELGEAVEAVRKPALTGHIEGLSLFDEEMADVIIRMADFAGSEEIDMNRAVALKMEFNSKRERMHGKQA